MLWLHLISVRADPKRSTPVPSEAMLSGRSPTSLSPHPNPSPARGRGALVMWGFEPLSACHQQDAGEGALAYLQQAFEAGLQYGLGVFDYLAVHLYRTLLELA